MTTNLRSDAEATQALDGPVLFGNRQKTELLALVAGLGETYPRELARISAIPLFTVQRIVNDFERWGVLATRLIGRERRVSLNPRFVAARELRDLLEAMLDRVPRYREVMAKAARRRPRRAGKAL